MLLVIGYFTLYLPEDQVFNSLIFQITTFLAGIALYFSSDTPQPLKFSLIDKIFQFFYSVLSINICIVLLASISFGLALPFIKFFIVVEPVGALLFVIYVAMQKTCCRKEA